MRILHLTLLRKWFEKIASGEKTKEFREIKSYWTKRLENREYDEAIMGLSRIVELSPPKEKEGIERQIEALEDQIFKQVKKSDSMGEYEEFLKKYPRSPGNSDEARLWIENKLQAKKMGNQELLSSDFQPSLATKYR